MPFVPSRLQSLFSLGQMNFSVANRSRINRAAGRLRGTSGALLGVAAALALSGGARFAAAQTYTGGTGFTVTGGSKSNSGTPGTLTVPNTVTGTISTISITLTGVSSDGNNSGDNAYSIEYSSFVLVSPSGQKMVVLGATGDGTDGDDSGTDSNSGLHSYTITVADNATGGMAPTSTVGAGSCWCGSTSWSVKPSSYWKGITGAVPGDLSGISVPKNDASATMNGTFGGFSPDGQWKLYVNTDDNTPSDADSVTVGGWSLTFTLTAPPPSTDSTATKIAGPVNSNPSATNTTLTYTATVYDTTLDPTENTPIAGPGTVTFKVNGTAITCGSGSNTTVNSSGKATCNYAFPNQGISPVSATYGGFTATSGTSYLSSSDTTDVEQLIETPTTQPSTSIARYCNTGSFTVPGGGTAGTVYPSVIKISNAGHNVGNVGVELLGASGYLNETQHVLVGPKGSGANLDFLDQGFQGSTNYGSINLYFADQGGYFSSFAGGGGANSQYSTGATPSSSVNYEATDDNDGSTPIGTTATTYDSTIPPMPGTINHAYPTTLTNAPTFESSFGSGSVPGNGTWALYVYNVNADTETINGGWCLDLTLDTGTSTTTTVTSNLNGTEPNGAYVGNPVKLTATVTASGSTVNEGTIKFMENGALLAGESTSGVPVSGGSASFTTSALTEGDHVIDAFYTDSSNTYSDSDETTFVQRIDKATAAPTSSSGVVSYCNTGGFTSTQGVLGAFSPNPSNIYVANLPGTVQKVTTSMTGLTAGSTGINAVQSMLAGPTGTALDFFSNTGGGSFGPINSPGLNLTFADGNGVVPLSAFSSGTYEATSYNNSNNTADTFTASTSGFYPLPGSWGYGADRTSPTSTTSTFNSTNGEFGSINANGLWSLFFNISTKTDAIGTTSGWCLNFTENPVDVTPSTDHTGDFTQGQTAAPFTVNVAVGATTGPTGDPTGSNPLTVTDTLPTGLSIASPTSTGWYSGTGWSCNTSSTTAKAVCTNDTTEQEGQSYPPLTIDVNVSTTAPRTVNNQVSVLGAGVTTSTNSNVDSITVLQLTTTAVTPPGAVAYSESSQNVAISAQVSSPGNTVNEGTVTFGVYQGGSLLGSGATVNVNSTGVAAVSYTLPAGTVPGTYSIHASYSDATGGIYGASSDNSQSVSIVAANTTTSAGNVTTTAGTLTAVTAMVSSGGGTVSEGAVTFNWGDGTPPTTGVTVSGGTAGANHTYLNGGLYSITATYSGTSNFNGSNNSASPATATVNQAPAITSIASTNFSVGVAGSFQATATGYPAPTFTGTGTVPAWLTISSSGLITGTPPFESQGNYPFTLTASNGIGTAATQSFSVTVAPPAYLVVNTTADTGSGCTPQNAPVQNTTDASCALRDALAESATLGAANIYFDSTKFTTAATITLTNGVLTIPANTTINGLTSGSGATLTNLITISGNNASGVFSLGNNLPASISNLNITGGHATGNGGGISSGGTLAVTQSEFSNNIATEGGAIYENAGSLTVTDSTFKTNSANDGGGGAILVNSGTATISYSTFNNNSGIGNGGAISNLAGTVTLTNSTLSGNTASASALGGAISNSLGTVTITNDILAGNTGNSNPDGTGTFTSGGHNLVGDGTGINGLTNGSNGDQVGTTGSAIAANLAPLDFYGGPTRTMVPAPGSPAICGGLNTIGTGLDQRGFANTNTTYLSGGTVCVDVGAAQTAYAISFTTPPPITVTTGAPMSPAPVVSLTENGQAALAPSNNITITDADSMLSGSGTNAVALANGVATLSNLIVGSNVSNDTLTATLGLTTYNHAPVNLTTLSTSFSSSSPLLGLAKTHPGTFTQGGQAEWDIAVSNTVTGTSTFGTVNVSDTLPTGYTLASYTADTGFTCTGTGTASVSCSTSSSIGSASPARIQLTVNVPANSATSVTNTAQAWGGGDPVHTSSANSIKATDPGVQVTQVPASIVINGSATQSAPAGGSFGDSLAVTVEDAGGVGVPGQIVQFTANTGVSGASGTFLATSGPGNSVGGGLNGVADPGVFNPNLKAGSYTVTATSGALSTTFNLTNTAGAANGFSFNVPPQAFVGWPLPVTVTAVDQFGNPVTSDSDTVQVTSTDSSATLPPNFALVNGQGTFQLTFNTASTAPPGWTFTVTDTSNSVATTSNPFFTVAPISLVVTSNGDGPADETQCTQGPSTGTTCTLRDAMQYASSSGGAQTITFDTTKMLSTTIALDPAQGPMDISPYTNITGPNITVSGGAGGIFTMATTSAQGVIDGLTISGGSLSSSAANAQLQGAAIANDGTLTLRNCTISGNSITASGASGIAYGGAIFTDNDLEISNCTISGNSASAGGIAEGGGIYNSSYMNATNVTVFNNTVKVQTSNGLTWGGGIFTGDFDMLDSTISGNKAIGPTDGTGAADGGGIFSPGNGSITYSTISGNSVTSGGTGTGGGIYATGPELFTNATIDSNTADSDAGGVYLTGSTLTLANTIINDNTAAKIDDFDNQGTLVNHFGNLIGVAGMNLGALANNGGATETMVPLPGSPAICNGSASGIPAGVTTDQRGVLNTTTYPSYSPTACVDSGAVETHYAIAFTQQPSTSSTTATIAPGLAISPAPAASVTENLGAISGGSVTLSAAAGTLSGTTSQPVAGGAATFNGVSISPAETSDTLTVTLPLNPALSTPLSLSSTSFAFNVQDVAPTLTSPSTGSSPVGPTVFTWTPGVGSTGFQLYVGTTGAGSFNIYKGPDLPGSATSSAPINIPDGGGTLYVRLWNLMGGTWQHQDFTFAEQTPPAITSPVAGTSISGRTVFTWTPGTGPTQFQVYVGTTGVGSSDLYKGPDLAGTVTSSSPVNIPIGGAPIYVRLWYMVSGVQEHVDYTYNESILPAITSPAVGTALGGRTNFTWNPGTGWSGFQIYVGTTGAGSSDMYRGVDLPGTATSSAFINVPLNGATLYVRLWYETNNTWQFIDYTYNEGTPPAIISPAAGTLLGGNVVFSWSPGTGSTGFQIRVGTTGPGSQDLKWDIDRPPTATSSAPVTIPDRSGTVYVRLWYEMNGNWLFQDYTYTEASPASIISPSTSTRIGGQTTFTWNPGSGFDGYQVRVGTTPPGTGPGATDVYFGANLPGTATSSLPVTIPIKGATLYVRLWFEKNGNWQPQDYVYTEAAPPSLTTPTPGSTIGGATSFTWSSLAGATGYQIYVGTTGPGSKDVYQGPNLPGTSTSSQSINIPKSGVALNVRLWFQLNNSWQYQDYTYTEQ